MERKNEFIGFRNRICDIVRVGFDWYDYRKGEEQTPAKGAFCRKCAKETAKPVYPIFMNGKEAYALKCIKCGSEYAMYKSMYYERYIGYDTMSGGHVNPTHGMVSRVNAMDRKAREAYNAIPQKVEDKMCETFGYTHEEYKNIRKKWKEEDAKAYKKFQAENFARFEDEERKQKSEKRKELIEKGILKYVKGIGLVNTETGEVVKL